MYAVINFYKIQHVSFSDQDPLLETLEFFEISQGSDQPLDLLLYKILVHTCSVGTVLKLFIVCFQISNLFVSSFVPGLVYILWSHHGMLFLLLSLLLLWMLLWEMQASP